MAAPKMHRGTIVRNFKDAGTGVSYVGGESKTIPIGAFRNYLHAGLVELPAPTPEPEPSDPPAD